MRMRLVFCVIAWLYLAVVVMYALATPPWQVPDEPAHYNYIRTIAETGGLPVLQFGDYDQGYLDAIKSRKFPADMPVDTIRYESHQPPLYYLLAAPIYRLGEGEPAAVSLISLRLFSSLLGLVLLALTYRLALDIFPQEPWIAAAATAVAAFVPQHVAMSAGVDNDALAELVLAAVALAAVRLIARMPAVTRRDWLLLGLLIGIGFLTKATTYVSVGLLAVTFVLLWLAAGRVIPMARSAVSSAGVAALLGSFWFARDAATYGPTDLLGLARHNAVVVGQPRTLDLYPTYWAAAADFFPTLFRSFWGQFGWMGVLLDSRLYLGLFAFSLFALLGLVPFWVRTRLSVQQRRQLLLVAAWLLLVLASALAYSMDFYQPQGRYLFPALPAIALLVAMGLRGWLGMGESLLAGASGLRRVIPWAALLVLTVGGVSLDLVCLYRFIVPQLRG